ncbi:MAG: ABC transporter substrate-binding protein [Solirubrobacteraceae bacterium]
MSSDLHRPRLRPAIALAAVVGMLVVAGCGSGSSSSSGSSAPATTGSGAATSAATSSSSAATSSASSGGAVNTSSCGPKPGVKATGTPILLGTINTKQPGTDFSDIPNMEAAYFACVNANGGVNGHPIKLVVQFEQTNPSQIAAEAKKLVQTDHVLGMAGNSSILECTINHKYWESQHFYVIAAGIAPECYSTPNIADLNMGPRYSSDGAVQYAFTLHPSKILFDQSNVPGTGYIAAGPNSLAKAAGVPIQDVDANVPISDANSVAIRDVQDAGPNGSIVLNYTPPEALVILQAAQKLGIEDHVKSWGCSTPCDTDFLAKALGPKWNHKFFVNSEVLPPDATNTPTMNLYKAILKQYGSNVSGGIGSFSQFGFAIGELATHALESIKGPYTVASVNKAFQSIKDFNTGQNCALWTFGNYPLHIANNMDTTVTPQNGKMVLAQGCTLISANDPQIAAYRKAAGTAPTAPGVPTG